MVDLRNSFEHMHGQSVLVDGSTYHIDEHGIARDVELDDANKLLAGKGWSLFDGKIAPIAHVAPKPEVKEDAFGNATVPMLTTLAHLHGGSILVNAHRYEIDAVGLIKAVMARDALKLLSGKGWKLPPGQEEFLTFARSVLEGEDMSEKYPELFKDGEEDENEEDDDDDDTDADGGEEDDENPPQDDVTPPPQDPPQDQSADEVKTEIDPPKTEEVKTEETTEVKTEVDLHKADPDKMDRDELRTFADKLGVAYSPNIGHATLLDRVKAAMESK